MAKILLLIAVVTLASSCSSHGDELVETCHVSGGLDICVYGYRDHVKMSFENMTNDTLHFIGPMFGTTIFVKRDSSYNNFSIHTNVFMSDDNSEILPRVKKSGSVFVSNAAYDDLELTYYKFDYPYLGDSTAAERIFFRVPFKR